MRPDGNTELAKLLTFAEYFGNEKKAAERYETTVRWLQRAQDNNVRSAWYGSFPFFLIDGYDDRHESSQVRFQNDNGKILLYMVQIYDRNKDERMLEMAKKLADYWTAIQLEEGCFSVRTVRPADFIRVPVLYSGPLLGCCCSGDAPARAVIRKPQNAGLLMQWD